MFNPTHLLVSRSRQTPVQLVAFEKGFKIVTEAEWHRGSEPAFEMRPKQGFFCRGVPVVGYSLQPMHVASEQPAPTAVVESTRV
ncbi:MAG: hypothetical protein IGS50_18590 [Synechococcales cyanobacterium C42_A2020_086]|jgi:hypothetical protein|nr:hypothetical protein [Synechococcales cyanobacterium C42_A2020_086]